MLKEKEELTDIIVRCKDCNEDFKFSKGEQRYYKDRGLENVPVRCERCRKERNNNRKRSINTDGFKDRVIKCKDCNKEFTFTAKEQAFYKIKGLTSIPVRCNECRNKKKRYR